MVVNCHALTTGPAMHGRDLELLGGMNGFTHAPKDDDRSCLLKGLGGREAEDGIFSPLTSRLTGIGLCHGDDVNIRSGKGEKVEQSKCKGFFTCFQRCQERGAWKSQLRKLQKRVKHNPDGFYHDETASYLGENSITII